MGFRVAIATSLIVGNFCASAQSAPEMTHELHIAQRFAREYQPPETLCVAISAPDSVYHAFELLRGANDRNVDRLLTLVHLKLYRSHLKCCHQSYGLEERKRASDLTTMYITLCKESGQLVVSEFITSSLAFNRIEWRKALLKDPLIAKEHEGIVALEKAIERGDSWQKN